MPQDLEYLLIFSTSFGNWTGLEMRTATPDSTFIVAVEGAGPIFCDCVEGLEGVDEVLCVVLSDVFDAKIVDDERECDGPSAVAEDTWDVGGGGVAVGM